MTTGGSITGMCSDGLTGSPYQCSPAVYRYDSNASTWTVYPASEWGNADGTYEVDRLPAGVYRLQASVGAQVRMGFSPDATSLASAVDIPVSLEQVSHVDTTLYPLESISGRCTARQNGAALGEVLVTLWSPDSGGVWQPVRSNSRSMWRNTPFPTAPSTSRISKPECIG